MKFTHLFLLFFAVSVITYAQTESPLMLEASYVGDMFSNFSGGIKTGQTYLGKMNFGMGANTADLGLWENGEFHALIENTHGGNPTASFIGDMQVASNIDNGDYTYLYDLWYKHNFNKLSLQFGVIDLNADYLTTESGGLFLNSSFGIQPSASMNLPVPIFPMNALGLNLHYQINDALSIQSGIWDGDPGDLDREPYNVQWKLSAQQGILSATELCLNHTLFNQNSGVVKWGMLYHSAEFNYITDSTVNIKGNMQFHLIADQTLINKPEGEKGKLDAFLQVGYLPKNNINAIPFYLGGGFNYKGILFKNANDVLGLAFAHATLSQQMVNYLPNMLSYETAIELSYSMPIGENITIQPDLQYIINPGADGTLDNAFIAFTRVLISY